MSTTNDMPANKQDQPDRVVPQTEQELIDEDLLEVSGGRRCDGDLSTDQSWYNSTWQMSRTRR